MSCARLHLSLLAARDARQEALERALDQARLAGWPATLAVALNIAGADKAPPGAAALFDAVMPRLAGVFPEGKVLAHSDDALGPYALIGLTQPAETAKALCIAIEDGEPAARLVDLDVYCADGSPMGRAQLGVPARRCLVCSDAAVDCMRSKRHALAAIVARTDELLVAYRT